MSVPFATEERHLVNIVTEAVIPDDIKEGVLTRDKIGQALFDTFAQERIVKAKLSVWSPMKKANLKSWRSAWQTNFKKNKTTCGVAPLKDDRALFARFLVVILSRPDLDIKETISTFELAEYPRALFFSDGSLRLCATKSKLMNILESLLPAQQQVSCSNTLKKAERSVLDAFSSLGTTETIPDDIYMMLERFVCQLYIPSTQLRTIGEV